MSSWTINNQATENRSLHITSCVLKCLQSFFYILEVKLRVRWHMKMTSTSCTVTFELSQLVSLFCRNSLFIIIILANWFPLKSCSCVGCAHPNSQWLPLHLSSKVTFQNVKWSAFLFVFYLPMRDTGMGLEWWAWRASSTNFSISFSSLYTYTSKRLDFVISDYDKSQS